VRRSAEGGGCHTGVQSRVLRQETDLKQLRRALQNASGFCNTLDASSTATTMEVSRNGQWADQLERRVL
jgi:hypothetical protein